MAFFSSVSFNGKEVAVLPNPSEEEELVFAIDRSRWPQMLTVWHVYEEVIGVSFSGLLNFTGAG